MTAATPILLDMDPGLDDAVALLLAVRSPEVKVVSVTAVAGNQTLDKTLRNTLAVLSVAGESKIPVAAGAEAPLTGPQVTAHAVHGDSGLGSVSVPEPAVDPDPRHAVEVMAETLRGLDRPAVLVPTGPLTNVALFLKTYPTLARERLQRVVWMGGAMGFGNVTPSAEFNAFADPEAARVVFHASIPVTMVGLDVTLQARVTREDTETLRRRGGPVAAFAADLLESARAFRRNRAQNGVPVHDACAVAEAIRPGLVATRPMYVDVETGNGLCRGRTVCDPDGICGKPPNAQVGIAIDVAAWKKILLERLS